MDSCRQLPDAPLGIIKSRYEDAPASRRRNRLDISDALTLAARQRRPGPFVIRAIFICSGRSSAQQRPDGDAIRSPLMPVQTFGLSFVMPLIDRCGPSSFKGDQKQAGNDANE